MTPDGGGFARFSQLDSRFPSGVHASFCGRQVDLLEDGAVNDTEKGVLLFYYENFLLLRKEEEEEEVDFFLFMNNYLDDLWIVVD